MTARFVDFDAILAEHAVPPFKGRLFGEDVELPGDIPAKTRLLLVRFIEAGDDDALDETEVLRVLEGLFGAERLDRWRYTHGDGTLLKVLGIVFATYAGLEVGSDPEGPAPGRGRPSKTASKGSRSSKPTSKRTTGSTSATRSRKA